RAIAVSIATAESDAESEAAVVRIAAVGVWITVGVRIVVGTICIRERVVRNGRDWSHRSHDGWRSHDRCADEHAHAYLRCSGRRSQHRSADSKRAEHSRPNPPGHEPSFAADTAVYDADCSLRQSSAG